MANSFSINDISVQRWTSPVEELVIGSIGDALCLCDWCSERRRSLIDQRMQRLLAARYVHSSTPIIMSAIAQLSEYFAGIRRQFDIDTMMAGTELQRSVWHELMRIPYGSTVSYAELARRVGRPKAVRAIASCVAMNPISIFVPCHRVIGSDNRLTGYAGGLDAKAALLNLESQLFQPTIDFK